MTNRVPILFLASCAGLLACGESMEVDSGAGGDAGRLEAGTREMDAAQPDAGSGAATDAGVPPPTDSGPSDADGDGVPDELDCAPDDAGVGASASRACSSVCGDGQESCLDGVWSACDAPSDCTCTTEGERRVASCAMCGEQSEECMGGIWTATSGCLNQGECEVGDVEMRDGAQCSVEQRICSTECSWGAWDYSVPPGECPPHTIACSSLVGDWICTDDCRKVDNPCCPTLSEPCCATSPFDCISG